MSDAMNHETSSGSSELERATAAVRASAASAAPSPRAVQALLDALASRQQAPHRQVMASGKGGLSLTEDALMKKWRFHEAFRPLSFESLERRRLLAATSVYQDDGAADRRTTWPDCLFLNVAHARGDRPQRRWDAHPAPDGDMPSGPLGRLLSDNVFGSELIFAA
jgi:hypothetical protein